MNRKAESYVDVCVLLILLCMILSVFISFVLAVNTVRMTERNSRVVLDSFVVENAIEIYNSIKNGNDDTAEIEAEEYIHNLCEFCTFARNGDRLYASDSEGNELYSLSIPTVGFETENRLRIISSYTVYVPLYFCGVKVTEAEIPIKAVSKYNDRFS